MADQEVANIQESIDQARALVGMLELPRNNRYSIEELLEQADNIRLALLGQL